MGVIVKQKPKDSGVWWVFINHHGRRKSKKIGKDKRLAREVAKKIEAKLVLGEMKMIDRVRFGPYSKKWLAFIEAKRRPGTYERYNQVLESHILPIFKAKPLDSITRGDIRDFLVNKSKKINVLILRDVLSGIFGFALDDEIVGTNPVTGITKRLNLNRYKTEDVEPFTEHDLATFLNACQRIEPQYYPFFLMAARTGMRHGELLALRWGDLDFNHKMAFEDGRTEERPFVWVQRSYRRGQFTAPKNGKSRKVDMTMQLRTALMGHLRRQQKQTLKQGFRELPELVFHRNGEVIEQNYIRRVFKRILRDAGLRDIKLHGLRHTFASLLLSMGESPVYVKEQLGHSSIQITVDIYGRWIQTKKEAGVQKLDTHLNAPYTHPVGSSSQ